MCEGCTFEPPPPPAVLAGTRYLRSSCDNNSLPLDLGLRKHSCLLPIDLHLSLHRSTGAEDQHGAGRPTLKTGGPGSVSLEGSSRATMLVNKGAYHKAEQLGTRNTSRRPSPG